MEPDETLLQACLQNSGRAPMPGNPAALRLRPSTEFILSEACPEPGRRVEGLRTDVGAFGPSVSTELKVSGRGPPLLTFQIALRSDTVQ
jgi:hypothetical protein